MDMSLLHNVFTVAWIDDLLVWAVAIVTGILGLVALVNAIDMVLETDGEAH